MAQIDGNVKINVNANQALQELAKLDNKASELRQEIIKLNKQEVLDKKQLRLLEQELKKVEKEHRNLRQSASDYNNVLKNLKGSSIEMLNRAYKQLNNEVNKLERNTEEWKQKTSNLSKIKSEIDETKAKMRGLNNAVSESKGGVGKLADGFNRFGGIALGIIAGVTMSISLLRNVFLQLSGTINEFEDSFTNVLTLLTGDQIEKFGANLEKGSIDLIKKYGEEISVVNKALFDTISASVDASKAIGVLDDAGTLAVAGVTNLGVATDGITTVINAFGEKVEESTNIANAFFTAQKFGKTTVAELATDYGKIAPILSNVNFTYQDGLSALAELTKKGISTSESVSYLKNAIQSLIKPSKEAEEVLRQYNVPVGISELRAAGFTKTLEALNEMIKQNPDAVGKAIPSVEGLTAVLALSGEGLEDFKEILNEVNTDIGNNSSMMNAYGIKTETTAFKIKQSKAEFKALTIELRDYLAPATEAVITATKDLTKQLVKLVAEGNNFTHTVKDIAKGSKEMGETLTDGFEIEPDKFTQKINQINESLWGFFNRLWNWFVETEKKLMIPFNSALKVIKGIFTIVGKLFSVLKGDVETTNKKLQVFKDIFQWLGKMGAKIISPITDGFKGMSAEVQKLYTNIMNLFDKIENKGKIKTAVKTENTEISKRQQKVEYDQTTDNSFNTKENLIIDSKNNSLSNAEKEKQRLLELKNEKQKIRQEEITQTELDAESLIKNTEETYSKKTEIIVTNEEQLAEYLRNLKKDMLIDEQARQQEDLKIWRDNETQKINEWVASEETKTEALLLINKQYNFKLDELNTSFNVQRMQKYDDLVHFINQQELKMHGTREQLLQVEVEKIRESYDQQILLAIQMAEKKDAYSEMFEKRANELRVQREEVVNDLIKTNEEEFQKQIQSTREQYGLVSEEERMNIELEQLPNTYEDKLLSEEDFQKAKLNIIDKYNKIDIEKTEKTEAEKLKKQQENIQKTIDIANFMSDFVANLKEKELTEAGDNEEKKKNIVKRYADIELGITLAKIIAQTALAVAKTIAELGGVGAITPAGAAVIAGTIAMGAIQSGVAVAQRNAIAGYEAGGLVTREQDNKQFFATPTNNRGIISKPSILVSENGPEYVVPNEGLRNPQIMNFLHMIEMSRVSGNLKRFTFPKTSGFETGGLSSTAAVPVQNNSSTEIVNELQLLRTELNAFKNEISTWQKNLTVDYFSFKNADNQITKIQTKANL